MTLSDCEGWAVPGFFCLLAQSLLPQSLSSCLVHRCPCLSTSSNLCPQEKHNTRQLPEEMSQELRCLIWHLPQTSASCTSSWYHQVLLQTGEEEKWKKVSRHPHLLWVYCYQNLWLFNSRFSLLLMLSFLKKNRNYIEIDAFLQHFYIHYSR